MFADLQAARAAVSNRLLAVGASASTEQIEQLAGYLHLLDLWNRRMNLTALEDQASAVDRLIVEPVMASALVPPDAKWLVDVGTGGGSPAIPLKIMRPELALTMIEVKAKKGVFLREVARHLSLQRVTVETAPFEKALVTLEFSGRGAISIRAVRVEAKDLALFAAKLSGGGQLLWFLGSYQELPALPPRLALLREIELAGTLPSRCVSLIAE